MCWLLNQVLRAQGDGLSFHCIETRGILKFTDPEMAVCQPGVSPGSPAGWHCWMLRARLVPEGPSA